MYKVGDKVKIRSWEDMAAEYGVDKHGAIEVCGHPPFCNDMKKYCGQIATITHFCPSWIDIDLDGGVFAWDRYMFEPLATITIPYFGDKGSAHKALGAEIAKVGGGAVREVKRPAKVGEYIKIVSGCGHSAIVGNIYRVERTGDTFKKWVYVVDNNISTCVRNDQYIVLENYRPVTKATPDRIQKAKDLIAEIVLDLLDGKPFFGRFEFGEGGRAYGADGNDIVCRVTSLGTGTVYEATAKCSPHDEWNISIGRAVALCKAIGRPLPDWV